MPCYAREPFKRYADIKFAGEWLTFVPAPRTLNPQAEATTDLIIQSIDKPILRVSNAMLCQEAPKRYADSSDTENEFVDNRNRIHTLYNCMFSFVNFKQTNKSGNSGNENSQISKKRSTLFFARNYFCASLDETWRFVQSTK